MPEPPYLGSLLRYLEGYPPPAGGVAHIEVRHDRGCRRPDGGPCTCAPEVLGAVEFDRCADCAREIPRNPAFAINRCAPCALRAGREQAGRRP